MDRPSSRLLVVCQRGRRTDTGTCSSSSHCRRRNFDPRVVADTFHLARVAARHHVQAALFLGKPHWRVNTNTALTERHQVDVFVPAQEIERAVAHVMSIRARTRAYNGPMAAPRFPYRTWLRQCVRTNGSWATLRRLCFGALEIARDSLPSRRRLRYGDIDFDCDHRVDTTWANIRLGTRVRELLIGRAYQPTDPFIFREMMERLPADPGSLTFVDLGSGKGRALLLAAEYPFRRIVGVELLPELHAIAEENVKRYSAAQPCNSFELHCGDARDYEFPPEPLFIYLFDAFPDAILRQVIDKVESSLLRMPREIYLGYQNPVSEHVVAASRHFRKIRGTLQWALYQSIGQT